MVFLPRIVDSQSIDLEPIRTFQTVSQIQFSETQRLGGLSTTDRRCASVPTTDGSVPTCLAHAGASSWKGPIDGEKPLGSQPHLSPFARGPCIARRSPVPGSVCCPRL